MSPETRAAVDAAKADCTDAADRYRAADRAAMLNGLARRWEAALRLPPLPDGTHDPLRQLGIVA